MSDRPAGLLAAGIICTRLLGGAWLLQGLELRADRNDPKRRHAPADTWGTPFG